MHDFLTGMGNTWRSSNSDWNIISLQQSSRNLCWRYLHHNDEKENTILFFLFDFTLCLDRYCDTSNFLQNICSNFRFINMKFLIELSITNIGLMSILGFYFPPETGEKVTLEITILVACVFFLNIVSDMQPPSSRIPLISTYFTCVLIMVACSVVRSVSLE